MPLWSFRSATGLFRQTQFVMLITAVISIALSFALGAAFGLAGVVIAPAITRLMTGAWYEPWLLIRDHLAGNVRPYFVLQIAALAFWATLAWLTLALDDAIPWGPLASMGVKAAMLAILLPVSSWLVFGRRDSFRSLVQRMRNLAGAIGDRDQKETA